MYVEGGSDSNPGRRALSEGLHQFLEAGLRAAGLPSVSLNVRARGRRDAAYSGFLGCLSDTPDVFAMLLVDAERPVRPGVSARQHLQEDPDNWDCSLADDKQLHLMVQTMEAWLVADPEALALFYGPAFNAKALSGRPNVEEIPKPDLETSLERAIGPTGKGPYRKLDHGSALLGRIDPDKVRKRAGHCELLFATLTEVLTTDP